MKFAIFSFLCLLSFAANCALYGWLESTVNMMEGFGQLFAPGATTVIFSPFLLLFIMLGFVVFIAAPMFVVGLGAALGGLLLPHALLMCHDLSSGLLLLSPSFATSL